MPRAAAAVEPGGVSGRPAAGAGGRVRVRAAGSWRTGQVELELLGVGILKLVAQRQHEAAQVVVARDFVVVLDRERHVLREELAQAPAELERLLPDRVEVSLDRSGPQLLPSNPDDHVRVGRRAAPVGAHQARCAAHEHAEHALRSQPLLVLPAPAVAGSSHGNVRLLRASSSRLAAGGSLRTPLLHGTKA